jgi:hypothetical protein
MTNRSYTLSIFVTDSIYDRFSVVTESTSAAQNNKLEDQNCEKKENAIKVRKPQTELSAVDSRPLAFQQSTLKVKKIKKHSST